MMGQLCGFWKKVRNRQGTWVSPKLSIPGLDFLFSLFVNETSEATDVDVLTACHVLLDHTEESLNRSSHVCLVYTSLFRNFVDYVCFGHVVYF